MRDVLPPGKAKWNKGRQEVGLAQAEWVVVDEADMLFRMFLPPSLVNALEKTY